jgi:hypothetical protein
MLTKSPKIALVYDRVNKLGGAERVLVALHQLYPQAPLYTALYDPNGAPWARGWDIHPSFLNRMSLSETNTIYWPLSCPMLSNHLIFPLLTLSFQLLRLKPRGLPLTQTKCTCAIYLLPLSTSGVIRSTTKAKV